jgi:hypothetical protein
LRELEWPSTQGRNDVDAARVSPSTEYDSVTVRREVGIVTQAEIACKAHRLASSDLLHPDVGLTIGGAIGGVCDQLAVGRDGG